MNDFMTVKEAAEKWNISTRATTKYCSEGRIPGVIRFNQSFAIPSTANKPEDDRIRDDFRNKNSVKPIIKWAGGKSQLLNYISSMYPNGLGDDIDKYAEPFIGGAAVLFDILSKYHLQDVYISDVNRELIGLYKSVRDHPEEMISTLLQLQTEHLSRDLESRKQFFYQNRDRFNELKSGNTIDWVECSSLFVYLNKTCFNGLYRVNSKGEFNVPSGVYKNPCICDEANIRRVSELLQGVRIECTDYKQSCDFVDERTFVYFDPPYRPLNTTSSFTSYTEGQFDDNDQWELAGYVRELDKKKAKVMVSNSDPKNTDPNDEFFDNLYSGFHIRRVPANRMINSKATGRGKINELLITNYQLQTEQMMIDTFD